MRLNFTNQPVDRLGASLVVLGATPEERPLRGAAGKADWRMYGFLSRLLQSQTFKAAAGEELLVPGNRQLGCQWILLVGLGSALELTDKNIHRLAQRGLDAAKQLRMASVALYYPHALLTPSLRAHALRWMLEGLSASFAKQLHEPLDQLKVYIPSAHEEQIDLASVMISKLLTRHSAEQLRL